MITVVLAKPDKRLLFSRVYNHKWKCITSTVLVFDKLVQTEHLVDHGLPALLVARLVLLSGEAMATDCASHAAQ